MHYLKLTVARDKPLYSVSELARLWDKAVDLDYEIQLKSKKEEFMRAQDQYKRDLEQFNADKNQLKRIKEQFKGVKEKFEHDERQFNRPEQQFGRGFNGISTKSILMDAIRGRALRARDQDTLAPITISEGAVSDEVYLAPEDLVGWARTNGVEVTLVDTTPGDVKRTATVSDEKKCEAWLESLIKAGPPKKPKSKYREDAKKQYGVGGRAFDRAWRSAIIATGSTEWQKPGPKS